MKYSTKQSIKRQLLAQIRISLLQKTDKQLLKFLLNMNKDELNQQVPNNSFPAWDIAERLYKNNWEVSSKQRKALINTASYYYSDYVFNKALSNLNKR